MSPAPNKRSHFSVFRRFARNPDGSAAVEFALIAPLFFAMVFAILETALVFFAGQALETGLHDTARLVLTGQAKLSNLSQTQFRDEVCNRATSMFTCSQIYVEVQKQTNFAGVDLSAKPVDACGTFGTASYGLGSPGDVMVVRAFYQWPMFVTGLGYYIGGTDGSGNKCNKRLLVSTAVFRNEP